MRTARLRASSRADATARQRLLAGGAGTSPDQPGVVLLNNRGYNYGASEGPAGPPGLRVDREMLASMDDGGVVVDMAVESGGNCELSELGEIAVHEGITIVGVPNLPATVPQHASELYAKNVLNLVKLFLDKEGNLAPDFEDEVLAGCRLTAGGDIHHGPTQEALGASSGTPSQEA